MYKSFQIISFLLLSLFLSCSPNEELLSPKDLGFTTDEYKLNNNITAYLDKKKSSGERMNLAVKIQFPDALLQKTSTINLLRFYEAFLLDLYKREKDKALFDLELDLGVSIESRVQGNALVLSLYFLRTDFAEVLNFLCDVLSADALINRNILEDQRQFYLSKIDDEPLYTSLQQIFYQNEIKANLPYGQKSALSSLSTETLHAWVHEALVSRNMNIYLRGNFEPEAILYLLNQSFGKLYQHPYDSKKPNPNNEIQSLNQNVHVLVKPSLAHKYPELYFNEVENYSELAVIQDLVYSQLQSKPSIKSFKSGSSIFYLSEGSLLEKMQNSLVLSKGKIFSDIQKSFYKRLLNDALSSQNHERNFLYFSLKNNYLKYLNRVKNISRGDAKRVIKNRLDKEVLLLQYPQKTDGDVFPEQTQKTVEGEAYIHLPESILSGSKIIFSIGNDLYLDQQFYYFLSAFEQYLNSKNVITGFQVYQDRLILTMQNNENKSLQAVESFTKKIIKNSKYFSRYQFPESHELFNRYFMAGLGDQSFLHLKNSRLLKISPNHVSMDAKPSNWTYILNNLLHEKMLIKTAGTLNTRHYRGIDNLSATIIENQNIEKYTVNANNFFVLSETSQNANEYFTVLYELPIDESRSLREISFVLSDIYLSGGWMNPSQYVVNRNNKKTKIHPISLPLDTINRYVYQHNKRLIYLYSIKLKPKKNNETSVKLLKSLLRDRHRELARIQRQKSELEHMQVRAYRDILLHYPNELLLSYSFKNHMDPQQFKFDLGLIRLLGNGDVLRIANSVESLEEYKILSELSSGA